VRLKVSGQFHLIPPWKTKLTVVNGVGSGHLLTDHKTDGDESTLAVTRDGEHLPQKILDGSTSNEHALVLKLIGDILDFSLNILVRDGQVAHASKHSIGFLPAILLSQESRRFLVKSHAAAKQDSRKRLKSKWDNVDPSAAGQVQKRAVVDPESETGSSSDEELVETGKTATDGTRRVFGNVKGNDHGGHTDTNTSDETSNVHDFNVAQSSGLEDTADDGDQTSDLQSDLASVLVSHPGGDEATDETPSL
jgi:hypothetical protein